MKYIIWITIIITLSACSREKEPSCYNEIEDGTETGVDCGGTCKVCPTCSDGIKNQDEVQIDCGGPCNACDIEYPETGTHGLNLLHGVDTIYSSGTGNSFKALIPGGSSLKIELHLISGVPWSHGSNTGWDISNYSGGIQTFDAINGGTVELKIVKIIGGGSSSGTILIKYFENKTFVTKQKILIWQ